MSIAKPQQYFFGSSWGFFMDNSCLNDKYHCLVMMGLVTLIA